MSNFIKGQRRDFTTRKHGKITIGGKSCYFRSAWEANVAAYLEMQKREGKINDWEFEKETFWFEKIRRGVRSYKPDFRVTDCYGNSYYIEVKGFMDKKSNTKIKRMRKYHPHITLEVWDAERYKEIEKMAHFIPQWGLLK